MKKYSYLLLSCLFTTTAVFAENTNFYIGASYLDAETDLLANSDKDSGFEARIGYVLNSNFSFEANYLDLGQLKLPAFPDAGGSVQTDGYGLGVLGIYPSGNFNLIGKLGYFWWDSAGTLGSIAGPVKYTAEDSEVIYGVGLSYNVSDNIELRTDYNDSQQFNWASLGLNFRY